MGWNMTLTADRDIQEKDVETAFEQIPTFDDLRCPKQTWGWPHVVDIKNPIKNEIRLSGASYSLKYARLFSLAFAGLLREMGYKIKIGEIF